MKTFLLDTSVLLHDPHCLKVFDDNQVVIPISVLNELDNAKIKSDEIGRNARFIIRKLDSLRSKGSLSEGVKLGNCLVRVELDYDVPTTLSANKVDDKIIGTALGLKEKGENVILVSKDINLRVKCDVFKIEAQDYVRDKIAKNVDSIYSGVDTLIVKSKIIDEIYANGTVEISEIKAYCNQFFKLQSDSKANHVAIARHIDKGLFKTIFQPKELFGITPRNAEQRMAVDILLDPNIKLVTLVGRAGSGKAQPLDSNILCPSGYVKMGDLKIGHSVLTPSGEKAEILGIYPQGKIDIYKVNFTDGTSTECSDDHLWYTRTQKNRDLKKVGSVKKLNEIRKSLRYGKSGKRNHSIPITKPLEFSNNSELPLDPYLLGLLLGDGGFTSSSVSISSADHEIIEYCKSVYPDINITKRSKYDYYFKKAKYDGRKNRITTGLIELNLNGRRSHEKFIPNRYKYSSTRNRINLLQGLMDSDGTISCNEKNTSCSISFSSTSINLANGVKFLIESLGGTATINSRITKYKYNGNLLFGKKSYRLYINCPPDLIPFKLKRKRDLYIPRTKYFPRRYIDSVEYIGKKHAQCIYIDHSDHLYLTNNFIVTHNTLLTCAAAMHHVISDHKLFDRALISRPIQPMGRDLGYLPGDIDEKLRPWMQPIYDNLDFLLSGGYQSNKEIYDGLIQVEPLTYIRGRSIPKSFIILDEAQNLSANEIKTIITRVGDGTKIIITGDIEQIDNPYVDFADNGLTHVVEKFKDCGIAGHVTLRKGERSMLATIASEIL